MRPTSLALEVRISFTVPGSQPHWTLSHLQGQARAVNQAITPPVPLLWSFSFGPLYQGGKRNICISLYTNHSQWYCNMLSIRREWWEGEPGRDKAATRGNRQVL